MAEQFTPIYINKTLNYKSREILSAVEFNALLNLLIAQGDNNARWLQYLQTEGIPDAIADISVEQLQEALTEAVRAEIAALAASVVNKTSAALNNPLFSVLNLDYQASALSFKDFLDAHEIAGDFCVATALVGASAAYPTLAQLQALKIAGHGMNTVGNDGSSLESLSYDAAYDIMDRAEDYMAENFNAPGVFVYPGGIQNEDVINAAAASYKYAVNIQTSTEAVDSEAFYEEDYTATLPVLRIDATHTIDTVAVRAVIDEALAHNKYCILTVDTSSIDYSASALADVLTYIAAWDAAEFTTIGNAIAACIMTINNKIRALNKLLGNVSLTANNAWTKAVQTNAKLSTCYVDNKNAAGTETDDLWLHWEEEENNG